MSAVCNVNAQTLTLRAADAFSYKDSLGVAYCTSWTDSITGNPADSIAGGYWKGTFWEADTLTFCDFRISHTGSVYVGDSTITNYWHGFTTGANGDKTNYGYHDTAQHVGSVKWIDNQWGVMAGGGLSRCCLYSPTPGNPYFVAYWDFYTPDYTVDLDARTLKVELADGSLFKPEEVYICNHPWPYYGNLYGDGFAQPLINFGNGAHVDLIIHAVKADGVTKDSITWPLAVVEDSVVYQDSTWQQVSLTPLFNNDNDSIRYLYFTMYSTDSDPVWGPNTAVYFNMDRLKVTKQGAAKATVRKPAPAKVKIPKSVEVKDYFPLTSYTGGEVTVYDVKGKVALKTTVKPGEKVNLSKLPKGEYRLRHGHRHIPVTKK